MCKLNVNIIVIIDSEQVTAFSVTNQNITIEHEYFNDHDIIFTNIDMNETERGMGNDGKCY